MNEASKIRLALLANAALFAPACFAQLPLIDFELPAYAPGAPLASQPDGLAASGPGICEISPSGGGLAGSQGLKIPKSAVETWVERAIAWDEQEKTAFIDFHIKPSAEPEGSPASLVANGSQIAFQADENQSAGILWVLDGGSGSPRWFKTRGSFDLDQQGREARAWMRVTLRHDYGRNIWDLFFDGKLAAVNLTFEGRGELLEKVRIYGGSAGDTSLDELQVCTGNPLFQDTDKDGLPDSWELENGSNPNVYDRDDILPGQGKSILDKYLESIWPSQAQGKPTGNGCIIAVPGEGSYRVDGGTKTLDRF